MLQLIQHQVHAGAMTKKCRNSRRSKLVGALCGSEVS